MNTPVPIDHDERSPLDDAFASLPFDAALAPRAEASLGAPRDAGWGFGSGMVMGALVLVLALGVVVVPRFVFPPTPAPSAAPAAATAAATVEEAFLLRCLTPDEAAALLRPLLRDGRSSIESSPRAPRVITVRTTPEAMQRVRATIHRYEEGDAGACARPTTPAPQ